MEDVFKIKTLNDTYGEVFVNAALDRESVDRYLLKVRHQSTNLYGHVHHKPDFMFNLNISTLRCNIIK